MAALVLYAASPLELSKEDSQDHEHTVPFKVFLSFKTVPSKNAMQTTVSGKGLRYITTQPYPSPRNVFLIRMLNVFEKKFEDEPRLSRELKEDPRRHWQLRDALIIAEYNFEDEFAHDEQRAKLGVGGVMDQFLNFYDAVEEKNELTDEEIKKMKYHERFSIEDGLAFCNSKVKTFKELSTVVIHPALKYALKHVEQSSSEESSMASTVEVEFLGALV